MEDPRPAGPGVRFFCCASVSSALLRAAFAAISFAGFLLVSGCGDQAPEPQSHTPVVIEPGQSVGEIHKGMKVDEVLAKLGEPQFRTGNALEYKRLGLAVMPDADGIVRVVMCGDVMGVNGPLIKNFNGRTKEGIGLLSTRDEVLKAYGNPSVAEAHPGGRQSLQYKELGITFSLEGGKVHHMIVRLGEEFHPPASIQIKP